MEINYANYHQGILDWIDAETQDDPTSIGNAFCQWCLENIFNLSSDQALDAMEVSGAYDHGIDAYIVLADDQVCVLQTKYESAHDWGEVAKFHYDMTRIRDNKVQEHEVNSNAQRVISEIQDAYKNNSQVVYYYVTSTEFTQTEKSKIEHLDGYEEDFFIWDITKIAQNLESKVQEIPNTIRNRYFNLRFSNQNILIFEDGTAVARVSLADMHDFVTLAGNDLFA